MNKISVSLVIRKSIDQYRLVVLSWMRRTWRCCFGSKLLDPSAPLGEYPLTQWQRVGNVE